MDTSILESLWSLLSTDVTLIGLLGGDVNLGWKTEAMTIPCATIIENNESSTQRPSYSANKHRDSSPTIQIDIWIDRSKGIIPCSIEDVETIAARVDDLLFGTGVTNTRSWRRVSSSGSTDENGIFHKALRYEFSYSVTD